MAGPSKGHVLVVEDEVTSRLLLSYVAEDQGRARVSQAGSAHEMNAVLACDLADLILLDLNLPDEDGLTLLRQVRARSEVLVVVITGDASRETRLAALEAGADDFLVKPIDPKELGFRVRNMLRRAIAVRGLEQPDGPVRAAVER